jgi:uncharacterized protein with von Willebrand factor type A (vWA) domain
MNSMITWTRRTYAAVGLTQYPVGRHLAAAQQALGGSVLLCLDVSASMCGHPLSQAIEGCVRFVDEAFTAHYEVGVILWDTGVVGEQAITRNHGAVLRFLRAAQCHGGTNIVPALLLADKRLRGRRGDLVAAIFGDGDLGDQNGAMRQSEVMRSHNIRIITCGLGLRSAQSLDVISTEENHAPRAAAPDTIADSIAGMATGLRRHQGPRS